MGFNSLPLFGRFLGHARSVCPHWLKIRMPLLAGYPYVIIDWDSVFEEFPFDLDAFFLVRFRFY